MFKTIVDPYVGHVNLFKVLQGTVKPDATLVNGRTMTDERLHQLTLMRGKEQDTVTEVPAGDIAAVAKLATPPPATCSARAAPSSTSTPFDAPEPVLAVAIRAKSKGDEDKLANALHRLQDEDPVLRLERNPETHQTVLWGMGETHLSSRSSSSTRKFGVEVETEDVRVAYRETITGNAEAEGKFKKQTGGHGQFGVAFLRVEPLERGAGFEFVDAIVGGVIPRQFIPAVEKGVARDDGAGRRVRLPRRRREGHVLRRQAPPGRHLGDGFKTAASIGFKEAMAKAHPILLEPVSELVVTVPEANQGDIMGDLNSQARPHPGIGRDRRRRGRDRRDRARRRRCCATRSTCAR